MQKTIAWLFFAIFILSFLPLNVFITTTVVAADPVELRLITSASDYTNLSFTDLGIYYTPQALCNFHMPFTLQRIGDFATVSNADLDGNYTNATGSFNERLLSYNYSILASNANFYIIDFRMNTSASLSNFSVDFVPKIKNTNFSDYGWWNSNWSYKKQVTIDYTQVPSTLSNFPVLVYRATDADLAAHATTDGGDIAFIDIATESIQYNHEIENYISGAGHLVAWVNVTEVKHDSNTVMWMYYGNGACADQWDIPNTWDSNYTGVFHMNQTGSEDCFDSTSNSNDGTYSTDLPDQSVAQIGFGQDFDGTNDNISFPSAMSVNTTGTIECWAEPDDLATSQMLFSSYGDTNDWVYIMFHSSKKISFNGKYAGVNKIDLLSTENYDRSYYYIAGAWTNNSDAVLWVNGTSRATDTSYETSNFTLTTGSAGTDYKADNDLDGELDELRISNSRRSNDWLETCYNNQINQSTFCTFSSEQEFTMAAPTNFNASTTSSGDITLSWTLGVNSTHTYVERSTSSSWDRGNGTFIYNNTGVTVLDADTSLVCNVVYYYQAWGFNSSSHQFSGSASVNNITCPGNPTSIVGIVYDGYLNLTWTKGTHADDTTVVRKSDSHPSSPTDGTVVYNGSLLYFNDSGVEDNHYYTLFSFNETIGRHSTGAELSWGQLTINVYDENTSEAIRGWDVFISNSDKTETYESLNNSNPLIIDIGDNLPYGLNTMIKINASGNVTDIGYNVTYDFKIYYMDLTENNHYTLDAYLSLSNDTESYIIRVINELSNPVDNAKVQVRRYINITTGYQNVSISLTDGSGYCPAIKLIPNEDYAVTISKTGYRTVTYDLFPIHIEFADDRYHEYTLYYVINEYQNETSYIENITFNGYTTSTLCYVNFTDASSNTNVVNITVYNINGTTGNSSIVYWYNSTSQDFQTSFPRNLNDTYHVVMVCDHAVFGVFTDSFFLYPNVTLPTSVEEFENIFDNIFGDNPFGWSGMFGLFILLAGLFGFGERNVGVSMIITGFVMIGFNAALGLTLIAGTICIIIIIFGILVQWRMDRRRTR